MAFFLPPIVFLRGTVAFAAVPELRDQLCLNGEWGFEVDAGDSGLARGLLDRTLSDRILVPFCPES